jgi:hypothetical protein
VCDLRSRAGHKRCRAAEIEVTDSERSRSVLYWLAHKSLIDTRSTRGPAQRRLLWTEQADLGTAAMKA